MEIIWDKAREIGRHVAQSEEYKALKRANQRLADDREAVAGINRLTELQESIGRGVQRGEEPSAEERAEYEQVATALQTSPNYQAFEVARANFDRLMMRIDEEIAKGIEAGEQSRIILST
jgi:cell fate (sporulation/competence/biofilm development) regulator YlbF (YheA/YmcA/DUF963 family)